ncbi:MAG: vanadium-dependent haloperoxidase [Kofleriaceae bacterium]|nr:vanadium-dependent haloperoxidase [Kofleriaceae bacterium]MBP6839998.1 vanadium-dependent haloperoxidase [Kofleriaceae bacterium]
MVALSLAVALAAGCGDNLTVEVETVAAQRLREAVLSIGGTSADDVWAVGADKGEGPLVLHYDGTRWNELETGEHAHLWWVHAFAGGPVFLSGAKSTILRYQGGQFERMATPGLSRHIVFGLWGAAPTDVYAVGSVGPANGFAWHYDGTAWGVVELPSDLPVDEFGNTPGLFKVWGDGAGTVWMVGARGLALRSRAGAAFERVDLGTSATLFTVAGDAERTYIVGFGAEGSVLFELEGDGAPRQVAPTGVGFLQGVAAGPDGQAIATGQRGVVLERGAEGWRVSDLDDTPTLQSFHAGWIDPSGGVWAVGGDVLDTSLARGAIVHRGKASVARFRQPPLPPPASVECPADAVDPAPDGASVARRWNEQILNAIRRDIPRPPVHARNLYHLAAAMWDAWAAYHPSADGVFVTEKLTATDVDAARAEAISYAAYRILSHRYADPIAVGFAVSQHCFADQMQALGYDPADTVAVGATARALGNRVGAAVIAAGLGDGANEAENYADTTGWTPVNTPLVVDAGGTELAMPSVWQQLNLAEAETQNGIPIDAGPQGYIGAHWRAVTPFAMVRPAPGALYHDLEPAPVFGPALVPFVADMIDRSSRLDPMLADTIDISPGAIGNSPLGTDDGTGHPTNPVTGQAYAANVVKLADFSRVLAEFWADGPKSETPPGHWDTLANQVADNPLTTRRLFGAGAPVDPLEWDVKVYLALNGATHDAAIAAWELKRATLGGRPISWVRYMATLGQSSDPQLPSYHPDGLPLQPGLIELITEASSARGERHAHLRRYVGQVAAVSWRGEPGNRALEVGGVGWVRAAEWMPYQRRNFVTPAFPGFVSGHSTFSRSAAEVLAGITGTPFFPGGLGRHAFPATSYLVFERGPSQAFELQWGTYFDAADQAGQSRLWGGIHITPDDLVGRRVGSLVGQRALTRARAFFDGTAR